MYSVDENSGVVNIQLTFSNPSSTDITVEVTSEEINATGMYVCEHFMHACHMHMHAHHTNVCVLLIILYRRS